MAGGASTASLVQSVYVDDKKGWKEAKARSHVEEIDQIGDLGEPTTNLDDVYLGCTQRECKSNVSIIDDFSKCSNRESPPGGNWKVNLVGRNPTRTPSLDLHDVVMRRSAWKDIANWQKKRLSSCVKSLHHVMTTITSKKRKNWKRWEICQKSAFKLS